MKRKRKGVAVFIVKALLLFLLFIAVLLTHPPGWPLLTDPTSERETARQCSIVRMKDMGKATASHLLLGVYHGLMQQPSDEVSGEEAKQDAFSTGSQMCLCYYWDCQTLNTQQQLNAVPPVCW